MFHRNSMWNRPVFCRMMFRSFDFCIRNILLISCDTILRLYMVPNDKHRNNDAHKDTKKKEKHILFLFCNHLTNTYNVNCIYQFYASISATQTFLSIFGYFCLIIIVLIEFRAFKIDLIKLTMTGRFSHNITRITGRKMTSLRARMHASFGSTNFTTLQTFNTWRFALMKFRSFKFMMHGLWTKIIILQCSNLVPSLMLYPLHRDT